LSRAHRRGAAGCAAQASRHRGGRVLMVEWTAWESVNGYAFEALLYDKRYRVRNGERCGGVARIRFNRPERMNAFTPEPSAHLIQALNEANRDTSIGVIVLSHTGMHFGVGGDVAGLSQSVRGSAGIGGLTPDTIIKRCLKPVIAVVRGYVIGMHHHMAYHCDFTIAGESAVFGQNGPRVGSPASGFLVASSAHVVGMTRARELWLRC